MKRVPRTGVVVGGAAGLAWAGAVGLAAYFTRRVVTPDHRKPDDVVVHAVDLTPTPTPATTPATTPSITLVATPETTAPGRYGLWWDDKAGHASLGGVLDERDGLVVRQLLSVEAGTPRPGGARWNQYFFSGTPTSALGLAHHDVDVPSELGPLPAWHIPAIDPDLVADDGPPRVGADTWAVLVHGRGATREECLRALPVVHRLGMDALVPSYRNDLGVPTDPSGRYRLGDSEWRDVESAVLWAVEHGARRVVLLGWSMGGAIILQLITRSWLADRVSAVVLDAPVVDWQDVFDHHSTLNHLPTRLTRMGRWMMRDRWARRFVGMAEPLDLRHLDWVRRADEVHLPVLMIHSDADEFVPNGPSLALAAARPDLVTVEPWSEGRHTKEWNTDPVRWESAVERFLSAHLLGAGHLSDRVTGPTLPTAAAGSSG